jgi:hypothetical protein
LTTRIGDNSVRVVNGKINWSNDDFATMFLDWLVATDPNYRSGWVWLPDIEKHLFKRFKAETGCKHLKLGALIRGLASVTGRREADYTDHTGRRRTTVEYWVGDAVAVVDLAEARRA